MLVAEAAALGWHLAGWLATVSISMPVVATVSMPVKACPIKRARYVPVTMPVTCPLKCPLQCPVTVPRYSARYSAR